MPDHFSQPIDSPTGDQNRQPLLANQPVMVAEAQRLAAKTSVSGRKAVSRGTMFLAFYLWLLAGAAILSFIAQRTEFFPGDKSITARLQKQYNPWLRRFFYSE